MEYGMKTILGFIYPTLFCGIPVSEDRSLPLIPLATLLCHLSLLHREEFSMEFRTFLPILFQRVFNSLKDDTSDI